MHDALAATAAAMRLRTAPLGVSLMCLELCKFITLHAQGEVAGRPWNGACVVQNDDKMDEEARAAKASSEEAQKVRRMAVFGLLLLHCVLAASFFVQW